MNVVGFIEYKCGVEKLNIVCWYFVFIKNVFLEKNMYIVNYVLCSLVLLYFNDFLVVVGSNFFLDLI